MPTLVKNCSKNIFLKMLTLSNGTYNTDLCLHLTHQVFKFSGLFRMGVLKAPQALGPLLAELGSVHGGRGFRYFNLKIEVCRIFYFRCVKYRVPVISYLRIKIFYSRKKQDRTSLRFRHKSPLPQSERNLIKERRDGAKIFG